MKPIARLCACAAFAGLIATSAHADEGFYLRVGGGVSLGNDGLSEKETVFPPPPLPPVTLDSKFEFDPGVTATAAVGYKWFFPETVADLRLELEGSYRFNEVDRVVGNFPAITLSDGVEAEAFGALVNGYLDLRTGLPLVPYIGAGAGAVRVSYEVPGGIDDFDTAFAHQLMGGAYYRLSGSLAIGVEYRYFRSQTLVLGNTGFTPTYEQQSILLNLSLGF